MSVLYEAVLELGKRKVPIKLEAPTLVDAEVVMAFLHSVLHAVHPDYWKEHQVKVRAELEQAKKPKRK